MIWSNTTQNTMKETFIMTKKPNHTKNRIFAFFVLSTMFYAIIAFISLSINPVDWHFIARIVYCILELFILNYALNTELGADGQPIK